MHPVCLWTRWATTSKNQSADSSWPFPEVALRPLPGILDHTGWGHRANFRHRAWASTSICRKDSEVLTKFCCIACERGCDWMYGDRELVAIRMSTTSRPLQTQQALSLPPRGHLCASREWSLLHAEIYIESPAARADPTDFARFLHRSTDNLHYQSTSLARKALTWP